MSYYAAADSYRDTVADALAAGARFADLHARPTADGVTVRTTLVEPDGGLLVASVTGETVPTIVDLAPAANWDEREAHDRFGVGFDGHEPLRPLVDHDLDLSSWVTPVHGADPYQVAVGPIHAGVIESGHFRFHLVGDRILHLDGRLFYKHRGLERLAEGRSLAAGLEVAVFACMACSVTNAVAYAGAVELLEGLTVDAATARARTLLLELERLWSHVNDVAAICAGVGSAPGFNALLAIVEEARRLNAHLTGHRFLRGAVAIGHSDLTVDAAVAVDARAVLADLAARWRSTWRSLAFNASVQDRLPGVGIVTPADAVALGAAGPARRAAGVLEDVRTTSPTLAYAGFTPVGPVSPDGDVRARVEQRALELAQTFEILDALLADPIVPGESRSAAPAGDAATMRVESPRGATTLVLHRNGESVGRLRLRTGSYANWPVVAACAADTILADFPLINKSFELCYACADR
jgi:Ni,Fe-hydrogenase III large subunit